MLSGEDIGAVIVITMIGLGCGAAIGYGEGVRYARSHDVAKYNQWKDEWNATHFCAKRPFVNVSDLPTAPQFDQP
jgi:coproporphyrinogen III oxidase-like Fe-S oxidoreductase